MSSLLLLVGVLVFVIAFVLLIRLYFKFRRAEETKKQVIQGQFFVYIGMIFLSMSLIEAVTNDGHPWLKLALGVSCLLDGIRRVRDKKGESM
ncbi:hypothetical protein JIR001_08140 [Polycladomyces abyssicola]|uniref:YtpI-like protein n=1 Tax=Polycladomyces abyssicola TaxID=1125966 RepID=A0A8D5ZN55_9BACL|nr:hypothetical protein [Polycladomyces abyssicola]BCU81031.1 hypothetical protein JIR001_08140 [Polycladomyces abyssicola]